MFAGKNTMKWKDLETKKFRKLDIRLEKERDVRFLSGLLHDAHFDLRKIRYARKRLTIPITGRIPYEWRNEEAIPAGHVNGELVLYPVLFSHDWQIALSGAWVNESEALSHIDIIEAALRKKTWEIGPNEFGIKESETYYHFRLILHNYMLNCSMDVLLRGMKDFPLIRYRDTGLPVFSDMGGEMERSCRKA